MADQKKILFLQGSQNSFEALRTAGNLSDGAFYFTTDTERLYIGQSASKAALLNQTVNIIDKFSNLPTWSSEADKAAHVNDFYYVVDRNILAVWTANSNNTGYEWVQINPDSNIYITDSEVALAAAGTGVKVTLGLTPNEGDIITSDFTVAPGQVNGKDTVKVAADNTNKIITVTGDTYELSGNVANDQINIGLSSELGQTSQISLAAGENVSFADGGDGSLVINSENWVPDVAKSSIGVQANGSIGLILSNSDNDSISISSDAAGYYIGSTFYPLGTDQDGARSVLDVYTTTEVDNKLKGLAGMAYRGTIGASGANFSFGSGYSVLENGEAAEIHNGDMFLVIDSIEYSAGNSAGNGDILIAVGEENADGVIDGAISWSYIPSGNDAVIDTTYSATATDTATGGSFVISSSTGAGGEVGTTGSITIDQGNDIVIDGAGTSGNALKLAISHADVATTPTQATGSISEQKFSAVTAITAVRGHVTGYETSTFTLPSYALDDMAVSAENNAALIKTSLYDSANGVTQNDGFKIKSDSLTIVADASETVPAVAVDLVWGTF